MENINIYKVRLLTVPGFRADSVLVFAVLIFRIAQNTKPSALESSPYVKYVPKKLQMLRFLLAFQGMFKVHSF